MLQCCAVVWGTAYGTARLGAFGELPHPVPDDADDLDLRTRSIQRRPAVS